MCSSILSFLKKVYLEKKEDSEDETKEDEDEEEEDEEMDGGTDYANNYFDNGEGFDEEEDNLDEGGVY